LTLRKLFAYPNTSAYEQYKPSLVKVLQKRSGSSLPNDVVGKRKRDASVGGGGLERHQWVCVPHLVPSESFHILTIYRRLGTDMATTHVGTGEQQLKVCPPQEAPFQQISSLWQDI
jgi:hypothetical protein